MEMGWNKKHRNWRKKKSVLAASAPFNLPTIDSDIVVFSLWDKETNNLIQDFTTIDQVIKVFYDSDDNDLWIEPWNHVDGSRCYHLIDELKDIERRIRLKKNYGYKI